MSERAADASPEPQPLTPGTVAALSRNVSLVLEWLMDSRGDAPLRASRFQRERLDAILRGDTPVPLRGGPALVLHVLPPDSLVKGAAILDIEKTAFMILGSGGSPTFNADGKLMWPEDSRTRAQRGYAQLGRTGWIEAASALRETEDEGPEHLHIRVIERLLLAGTLDYLTVIGKLGLQGSVLIAATLVRVRGYTLTSQSHSSRYGLPVPVDELALPGVTLPITALTGDQLAVGLRPALDVLWQARGCPRCPDFTEIGE
jgi:hypothetical protein